MSRFIPLFTVAIVIASFAFAGGWIEDTEDKTIIHVIAGMWVGVPSPNDTSPDGVAGREVLKRFCEKFNRIFTERYKAKYIANPEKYGQHNWNNVEVQLHPFSGIIVDNVEHDTLAIAGDNAPDILYVNFRKSDTYIYNNFLYPLDKPEDGYVSSMTSNEIAFCVHPKVMPVVYRKGTEGKKQFWAMPNGGVLAKCIVYRKDIFDKNKVPYPHRDWTWDDYLSICKKVTDPKNGIYGLMCLPPGHRVISWHYLNYLWSSGGEVMKYDEAKDEWRCTFDGHEAEVAADFFNTLYNEKWTDREGKVRRGYVYQDSDMNTKFANGQIAMHPTYIEEQLMSRMDPSLYGIAPIPVGPSGKRGGEINNRMLGLFSGIKHPAIRDAAWEFIRYSSGEEAVGIKVKHLVASGMGQFMSPRYLKLFGYEDLMRLSPPGWFEIFDIAVETGNPEPYGRNSNLAYDLLSSPINNILELGMRDGLPADRAARIAVIGKILAEGNTRANEEMIGKISKEERQRRDIGAIIALILIVAVFGYVFYEAFKAFVPKHSMVDGIRAKGIGWNKAKWAYLLVIPALASILVWRYLPLAQGLLMAFQDYRLVGKSVWVGVQNFGDIIFDYRVWWLSVWNALRYSLLVIALTFIPPVFLAIMLQEIPRGSIIYRIIYYLPAVLSGLITMLLWKMFFAPGEYGLLNSVVMKIPAGVFLILGGVLLWVAFVFARRLWFHNKRLGSALTMIAGVLIMFTFLYLTKTVVLPGNESFLTTVLNFFPRLFSFTNEPYRWLQNPDTAMVACVLPLLWAGVGPGCLIYLAALKSIPEEAYEAADVDGANFTDKVIFVVFPMLLPLIIINFVGVFVNSWYNAADYILIMTGGGANTEVAGLHIFYKAFSFLKFGQATAMAWLLGLMLVGFTVYQLRILSRMEFRRVEKK